MAANGKTLRGDLATFGPFDLCQLFILNRASGCLTLRRGEHRGYLYFREGRAVHALDDLRGVGEEAAFALFTWTRGTFEFEPEKWHGEVSIEGSTESLMMEAARRLDETAFGTDGDGASEDRLRARQREFEALREAFGRVAKEAKSIGRAAGGARGAVEAIGALSRPSDRIVFRAGHAPRVRRGTAWSAQSTPPLSTDDYAALRDHLLEASAADTRVSEGEVAPRIAIAGGRKVAIALVGQGADESLWLRPVDLPPPDSSRLSGDLERLAGLTAPAPSLTLIGGPTFDAARDLLHAYVAILAEHVGGTIILASEDETYRHRESTSLVVRVSPSSLVEVLPVLDPEVVTLDPTTPLGDVPFAETVRVSRLVAAVVAPDAARMVPEWLAKAASHHDAAGDIIGARSIGLLFALPGADDDDLAFDAYGLTPAQRSMVANGDFRSLASALGERSGPGHFERRAS